MKKLSVCILLAGLVQANDLFSARRIPTNEDYVEKPTIDFTEAINKAMKREEEKKQKQQAAVQKYESLQEEQFFAAAAQGNIGKFRELLAAGVEFKITNKYGMTALMIAADSGQFEMVEFLMKEIRKFERSERSTFLKIQDINGNTAIHLAAKKNNEVLIEILFNCGYYLLNGEDDYTINGFNKRNIRYIENNEGQTYHEILEENNALKFYQAQLEENFGNESEFSKNLYNKYQELEKLKNDPKILENKKKIERELKIMFEEYPRINQKLRHRLNELNNALLNLNQEGPESQQLKDERQRVQNELDSLINKKFDKIKELKKINNELIKNKGNLSAIKKVLENAKLQAEGHIEKRQKIISSEKATELLLSGICGLDLNLIEKAFKNNPNASSIKIEGQSIIPWLIDVLIHIHHMHIERIHEVKHLIKYVIENVDKNTLNMCGEDGITGLGKALELKDDSLCKLLLEKGANPNIKTKCKNLIYFFHPLLIAILKNKHKLVKYLLENFDVDINAASQGGITPLMSIVMSDKDILQVKELLKLLLEHGANVNIKNDEGLSFVDILRANENIKQEDKESILKYIDDYEQYKKGTKSLLLESPIFSESQTKAPTYSPYGIESTISNIIYEYAVGTKEVESNEVDEDEDSDDESESKESKEKK